MMDPSEGENDVALEKVSKYSLLSEQDSGKTLKFSDPNVTVKRKYLLIGISVSVIALVLSLIIVAFVKQPERDKYQWSFSEEADTRAIEMLQSYVQIDTRLPSPDYKQALSFLSFIADSYGFEYRDYEYCDGRPMAILTLRGTQPNLKSLGLMSHIDVVPTIEDQWHFKPGEIDANGNIYGRGTQDDKVLGIEYLEAVIRLKSAGFSFPRTLHLIFAADEEIGGKCGIAGLVDSKATMAELNLGFVLDEGYPSPESWLTVYPRQRSSWPLIFTASGPTGHASRFLQDTAVEKLYGLLDKVLKMRKQQEELLNKGARLGDVITLNPTFLQAGISSGGEISINVIPSVATLGVDIRIPPGRSDEVKALVANWLNETGLTKKIWVGSDPTEHNVTELNSGNIWWKVFNETCSKSNLQVQIETFPAGADLRKFQDVGVQGMGFSPIIKTTVQMHGNDEFIHKDIFFFGIKLYVEIIKAMSAISPQAFD